MRKGLTKKRLVTNEHKPAELCDLHLALEKLGPRWTLLVLRGLLDRSHRFSELRKSLPCIPDRSLARVLDRLEWQGIITRRIVARRPPQVVYSMAKNDPLLRQVIRAITRWGKTNSSPTKTE